MKSYTDLQQSKKLAEILPLESADMCWFEGEPFVEAVTGYEEERAESHRQAGMEMYPCWSLAALLSIIPQEIFDGEYIINITEGLNNKWILTYDHFENRSHSYYSLTTGADNLADACYELILKLHELKML